MRQVRRAYLVVPVVCMGLLVAACTSDEPPVSKSPQIEPAYAAELTARIQDSMKGNAIPGAVVLIRSAERGDWSAAFGTRKVGVDDPVTVDDTFGLADITATMTATVVMQLAQQGKLSLSDPISRYVDGVPGGDQITLEDLGEYRSNLYSYDQDPGFQEALKNDPGREWTPSELLSIAFAHPPVQNQGDFNYSKTDFILLGLVIEKVTGVDAATAYRTMLFEPLGLDHIGLTGPDGALPDPHPHGYQFAAATGSRMLPPDQRAAAVAGELQPVDHADQNLSYGWTADGAYGTADDLADYFRAIVSGPLVDDESRLQRSADTAEHGVRQPGNVTYGFGIATHDDFSLYGGAIPGFNSFVAYSPDQDMTIVILTNLTWTPDGGSPVSDIFAMIRQELSSNPGPPITAGGTGPMDVPMPEPTVVTPDAPEPENPPLSGTPTTTGASS